MYAILSSSPTVPVRHDSNISSLTMPLFSAKLLRRKMAIKDFIRMRMLTCNIEAPMVKMLIVRFGYLVSTSSVSIDLLVRELILP